MASNTEDSLKAKSIKNTGTLISVIAGLIILGNGMGALVWTFIGVSEGPKSNLSFFENPLGYIIDHYVALCLTMVMIGIGCLIGGLNIQKYKLWANRWMTLLAILLIFLIWTLMLVMSVSLGSQEGMQIFKYGTIVNAIVWSTPLVLLIRYLNKKAILSHFER